MADLVGLQLGSYRLIRLLGEGGFATVYQAEHCYLKHTVALKVMHAHLSEKQRALFLKEAQTLFSLSHPHIIRVLDFAVEDGMPFLVMDYMSYGTLSQRHPRGIPLPEEVVVSYVKQIADALQYAHDQQIIHRDIKPENILLGSDGEVMLSDFGIAVVKQHTSSLLGLDVAGTPAYMAPEQIKGKPCQASDQYALGIMAYEWLCGERPFKGSALAILNQRMNLVAPSLRAKRPSISPGIEEVVLKAIAKEPLQRFASVQDFATALEQAYYQAQPVVLPTTQLPQIPLPQMRQPLSFKQVLLTLLTFVVIGACMASLLLWLLQPHPAITITSQYAMGTTPAVANGTSFHVIGYHFSPFSIILFLLDNQPAPGCLPVLSDRHGTFIANVTVTTGWPLGRHRLVAEEVSNAQERMEAMLIVVPPWQIHRPGPVGHVTLFALPTSGSQPDAITAGPDDTLWFTEVDANKIGWISTCGNITEFAVPASRGGLGAITTGPDGNVWFIEDNANEIGRITVGGNISLFAIPIGGGEPVGIAAGPDGNIWFTADTDQIGRITPTGHITLFTTPTAGSEPTAITTGPDGNIWFTEDNANKIGRITTSGNITEFAISILPGETSQSQPAEITTGPGGDLWFTEGTDQIGRITTSGNITGFSTLPLGGEQSGIAIGPDGSIWLTKFFTNQIWRITTSGSAAEFAIPASGGWLNDITTGPDGNIWFTESGTNQIGRITSGM